MVSILMLISKKQLLVSLIFLMSFQSLFTSILIFLISFFLLTLHLICSCGIVICDVSYFLKKAFITMNFPLRIAFFWISYVLVCCTFIFVLKYFLVCLLILWPSGYQWILISTYLYIFQFSPHNLFLVSYYYGWEKRPDIILIFLNLLRHVLWS